MKISTGTIHAYILSLCRELVEVANAARDCFGTGHGKLALETLKIVEQKRDQLELELYHNHQIKLIRQALAQGHTVDVHMVKPSDRTTRCSTPGCNDLAAAFYRRPGQTAVGFCEPCMPNQPTLPPSWSAPPDVD